VPDQLLRVLLIDLPFLNKRIPPPVESSGSSQTVPMKWMIVVWLSLLYPFVSRAAEPKPITVAVGQEFEISLESPSVVDHQWLLSKPLDESRLKQSDRRYKRGVAGRHGIEILRYKAIAKGKTQICLRYASLWDNSQVPVQNTNFVILIGNSLSQAAK
jgi:predicted secreted protein